MHWRTIPLEKLPFLRLVFCTCIAKLEIAAPLIVSPVGSALLGPLSRPPLATALLPPPPGPPAPPLPDRPHAAPPTPGPHRVTCIYIYKGRYVPAPTSLGGAGDGGIPPIWHQCSPETLSSCSYPCHGLFRSPSPPPRLPNYVWPSPALGQRTVIAQMQGKGVPAAAARVAAWWVGGGRVPRWQLPQQLSEVLGHLLGR